VLQAFDLYHQKLFGEKLPNLTLDIPFSFRGFPKTNTPPLKLTNNFSGTLV